MSPSRRSPPRTGDGRGRAGPGASWSWATRPSWTSASIAASPDLGPTGNGGGYGFLLHDALVVAAEDERVVGLAGERVHYRKPAPKGENTSQRLKRDRESDIWGDVIDQVGPPPAATSWVHVLDRGADNFDVYRHCRRQRSDWVVRASMLHRKVVVADGGETTTRDLAASSPEAGGFTLQRRARPKQAAR